MPVRAIILCDLNGNSFGLILRLIFVISAMIKSSLLRPSGLYGTPRAVCGSAEPPRFNFSR